MRRVVMPTTTKSTREATAGRARAVTGKRSERAKNAGRMKKTVTKARSRDNTPSRVRSTGPDAVTMLKDDHKRVDGMFKQFDKMKTDGEEKRALVNMICKELKIHTTVEEEIFYPAVREAIRDDDLMDEADVEHESAKALIAQLECMRPGDDHYDAKVTVLGEYIRHHVREEHEEMFPKARKAKVDLKALGAEIAARKERLSRDVGTKPDLIQRVMSSYLPA
jgi:Hemerythrin HHE cation binding domain